jgi:hypothetical protein
MNATRWLAGLVAAMPPAALAAFEVTQVFSDADGTVQCVYPEFRQLAPDYVVPDRLWNNRADSNHRYTTEPATKAQMIARGYVAERSPL